MGVKRKEVCWFYKYKECKSGKKCSYFHPPSVRQKERDRYRDRLSESQDYGRSVNGRQNDKRIPHAPHNTDEYKYRNKYNYGSYRDHANSHQGSRSHQYPQKSYSSEKQNQSTHFLGYLRNPNYRPTETKLRPTPVEERLLMALRVSKRSQAAGFLQDGRTRDHSFIYFLHKYPPKFSCGKYPKVVNQERTEK